MFQYRHGPVAAIRHVITPSASISFRPDFSNPRYGYYRTVQIDTTGRTATYSIFQNGIYDVQYLMKYRIRVRNFSEDTMLLHHSLYPALPKSLDFLGSIYANEQAWKRWRLRGDEDYKKDE